MGRTTTRGRFTVALLRPVAFVLGVLIAVGVAAAVGLGPRWADSPVPDAPATATTPPDVLRVQRLIERHDCWTDEAPEGVIPGHAIVETGGGPPRLAASRLGFDIWLGPDEVPGSGDEAPGRVLAFCP